MVSLPPTLTTDREIVLILALTFRDHYKLLIYIKFLLYGHGFSSSCVELYDFLARRRNAAFNTVTMLLIQAAGLAALCGLPRQQFAHVRNLVVRRETELDRVEIESLEQAIGIVIVDRASG